MLTKFRYCFAGLVLVVCLSCLDERRVLTQVDAALVAVPDTSSAGQSLNDPMLPYQLQYRSLRETMTVSEALYGLESRSEHWRDELAYFVCDAVREEGGMWCRTQTQRDLDLVILNKSPMHRGLAAGTVTRPDLWAVYPDFDPLVLVELSGRALRLYLAALIEKDLKFAFSGASLYLEPGTQIMSMEIQGKPLNDLGNYLVLLDQRSMDLLKTPALPTEPGAVVICPFTAYDLLVSYGSGHKGFQKFDDNRIRIIR